MLLCAAAVAAQTAERPSARKRASKAALPAPPSFWLVDVSADGTDHLTAEDFRVAVDGSPRKISGVWRLDAKTGTIAPASADIPLTPDQIHRTIVLIADDLGMTAAQSRSVRQALTRFVEQQMQPTDVAAVLRTASAEGAVGKLTGSRRDLTEAIQAIQYDPGQIAEQEHAAGARAVLRSALAGLGELVGRKAVVMFTANPALLEKAVSHAYVDAANASAVTFSAVDVSGAAPSEAARERGLGVFAGQTGGGLFSSAAGVPSALAAALDDQSAYYLVRYEDSSGNPQQHPLVTANRGGTTLRARKGVVRAANFLAGSGQHQAWRPTVTTAAADLRRGLIDPLDSGAIPIRFAAAYFSEPVNGTIEGSLHIDARELTLTRRLNGQITGSLDIEIAAFDENGMVQSDTRTYPLQLTAERYQEALRMGFTATPTVSLHGSGPLQVRVSVRDGTSGRIGSAGQFLNVPEVSRGQLAIDGIALSSKDDQAAGEALVHRFHADAVFTVSYQILNLTADENRRSKIETQASVLRDGDVIYRGKPLPADFTPTDDPKRRRAATEFRLGKMEPGLYALRISVRDMLSQEPRTAILNTFFQVLAQ